RRFHAGASCGVMHYGAELGVGLVHLLRSGTLEVVHRRTRGGPPQRLQLREPTLLFYPRPCSHDLVSPPPDGTRLVCASVRFEGGEQHPLARALPPLVVVPLAALPGLRATLELLFAEADHA